MEHLVREWIAAARGTGRNPGFSFLVIATLALTLGCCTAVITLVDAVLLKPLPYPEPSKLVLLFRGSTTQTGRGSDLAPGNCRAIAESRIFSSVACWMRSELTITGSGEAENVAGTRIEPHLFDVLGVSVARGRKFEAGEVQSGRDRVVIITHELWQRRFGATGVLGRSIELDGKSHVIVGILPPGFRLYQEKAEVFTPLSLDSESWASHSRSYLQAVARIYSSGTLAAAKVEISKLSERLSQQFPVDNRALRLDVIPMQEDLTRQVRGPIQLLLVTAALLLSIGLANIANLFLTRMHQRAGEFSIRRGLGATTAQLMLQITIEPLLLCFAGGVLGLVLANWSFRLLEMLVPPALSSHVRIELNWVTMLTMVALVFSAAVAIATPSALRAAQLADLRSGTQRLIGSRSAKGFQIGLLAFEVACAFFLVIAANLLVQSWREVTHTPLGMNPDHLLLAKIPPPSTGRLSFYDRVLATIESRAGVQSAAFASTAPLLWRGGNLRFSLQGENCEPGTCVSLYREVTSNYFTTLQIPLRKGRYLGREDHENSEPVVVVNDTFARRFFSDGEAVGHQLRFEEGGWMRIVGVVADTREMGLDAPPRQTLYMPYRQSKLTFAPPVMLMVRAERPSGELLRGITSQAISEVRTMNGLIESLNEVRTLQSSATAFFAGAALLLAGAGLYGILGYALLLRRREMGIRIALGASSANIMLSFNRAPVLAILSGLALGWIGALGLTSWIQPLLVGVKATDPAVYVVSTLVLLITGLLACWQPTRHALKIPPAEALRQP